MTQMIEKSKSYSNAPWPLFDRDELEAVQRVMMSSKVNYWTGNEARLFEREYADYLGVKHAIALHNGTVAIELALYAFGIGEGDEVITTSRTFIASASAAVMRGAIPVIADVDSVSQDLTADTVRAVLTPRTRAVVVVHLAGFPCDMDEIMALAAKHNLIVIEDCAQSHGAFYKGRPVGSIGHAGAFSFCQDKIMSTVGEGGLLALNDTAMWAKAWAYKDHGKSFEAVYERQHPLGNGFRWLHESFGTNWRMLEVQATVGRLQLQKLPGWVAQRRANAAVLTQRFSLLPGLRVTPVPDHVLHAYYKYYVFVRPERLRKDWSRDRIMSELSRMGIPCYSGSCSEIYLEKAFVDKAYGPTERLPIARELGETSLMFLVHPTLSVDDMHAVADAVEHVMQSATQ
jgi:dTDP-4-amino-4,6-dideoxygalactose transaminase